MANLYTQGPRRVAAKIELHPSEIAGIVLQPYIMDSFTEAEIRKIIFELETELRERKQCVNPTPTE